MSTGCRMRLSSSHSQARACCRVSRGSEPPSLPSSVCVLPHSLLPLPLTPCRAAQHGKVDVVKEVLLGQAAVNLQVRARSAVRKGEVTVGAQVSLGCCVVGWWLWG